MMRRPSFFRNKTLLCGTFGSLLGLDEIRSVLAQVVTFLPAIFETENRLFRAIFQTYS